MIEQLQLLVMGRNAFFEPEAAMTACKAEDIMTMPADRLAQVAWPLLSDAERTLSMRDVLFTPPMRVSASPRATEAVFAAGVQSCLTELTENLAEVNYGESPLSMARLRAAALAYQICAAAAWPVKGVQGCTSATTAASPPLQLVGRVSIALRSVPPTDADAFFDFALPSFISSEVVEEVRGAAKEAVKTVAAQATSATREAHVLPATAIHSSSLNHLPDTTSVEAHVDAKPLSKTEQNRKNANDTPKYGHDTLACLRQIAADRASYERKTRSFVSEFVDSQWEAVVASALRSDDTVNTASGTAGATTTAAPAAATKATPHAAAAALTRHKMLRTALVLCQKAPSSAAAGHSFVCLLKHTLRAVSATDTIRCSDGCGRGCLSENVAASAGATAAGSTGTNSSPSTGRWERSSTFAERGIGSLSEPISQTTVMGATVSAAPPPSALQLRASLWSEVALALLHCVPLVQWTDDVLVELGQVLETVAAAAPPKLVAIAQQQRLTAMTAGRHGESSRAARCSVKKPTFSTAAMSGGVAAGGTVGEGAEQAVDFNVRIPFKVGLPEPVVTQEELLRALYHAGEDGQPQASPPSQQQQQPNQQPSMANGSVTSATGNNDSSYPSSAFHEVPDIRDEEEVTEEVSIEDEYTTTSGSSEASSPSPQTERASALNVSINEEDEDEEVALGVLLGGPRGDFEAQPCCRRRTQMVEFSFPQATRVSVRFLESVDWEHENPRGRDVLLLPLESTSSNVEKNAAVTAAAVESPSLSPSITSPNDSLGPAAAAAVAGNNGSNVVKTRHLAKDTLPLSFQSIKADRNEALTHNGPCRVAIPSLQQEPTHIVAGEVTAHLHFTLDTRWSSEWVAALATAQRTIAERLLGWVEARAHASAEDAQQQRRSRVASCVLLRGGLKTSSSAAFEGESKTYAAVAASTVAAEVPSASASAAATASATTAAATPTAGAGLDAFIAALLEMSASALRARVRCHTVHAEGVRATLVIIAHTFLQDRHGYLHGDPLTWHTPAWSEAIRRVSLASNVVGAAAVSGEAAMEVALFLARHVAGGCVAANTTRAQVIDAAIDLMSIPGITLADVRMALEDRRQISTVMWTIVDLLTKCSAVARAPKHVMLVSQAVRRLLFLGCTSAQNGWQQHPQRQQHASQLSAASSPLTGGSLTMTAGLSATTAATAAAAAAAAATAAVGATPSNHYLSLVNSCGRATETNLRRGVHGLLTQLFRLLKALLHRIQSTQAAPHRFLLEPWEYGAFAVFTVSLMSAPMDAADVQLCAPLFADIVTGLLPSFTRLSRTESLLLSSESEEHKFLVEVARHVRGGAAPSAAAAMNSESGTAELGEADTPASREPQIVRKVEETASSTSTASTAGEGVGVWDVLQSATAASWTPGHVRVEIWNGTCNGFYVGLASADLPADVCGPERDPNGIYFMGDGTLQYGHVTRKQRRLPRWHAGDVVELSFVFAKGNWDVVMSLNGLSLVRLTLPRRDFRLVAVNVRSGEYVPGHKHVHVLSVSPIYGKGSLAVDKRRQRAFTSTAAARRPASLFEVLSRFAATTPATTAPADVRLSPFSRLTVFNVSLFLELVLHYLVLRSSRHHYSALAATTKSAATTTAATGSGGGGSSAAHPPPHAPGLRGMPRRNASSSALAGAHAGDSPSSSSTVGAVAGGVSVTPLSNGAVDGVHLVQMCTAPLQHSLQQLVHLLQDLSDSDHHSSSAAAKGESDGDSEAYEVKRMAAQHVCNAMLLDLVVTLSISLPASTATLAMTIDVLTAVVECEAVARKTRTVALSALYNAITQHMFSEAISPVHAGAMRRLWMACYQLATEKPGYQPRFSAASVPATSVVVFAGGRRVEHRRVSVSTTLSGNVRSMSYACNPINLDDRASPEVVRVSVRIERGFQCETLGRYYYFGLADVVPNPSSTPVDQATADAATVAAATITSTTTSAGELTKHPGERAKQRRTYYISDYLSEVPDAAVQKADVDRAKHYLNPESNIIFGSGDVVTAVVYVRERCIGFERNGLLLNVLYRAIPSSVHCLYPFVELYNRDSRAKWMYPPDEAVMSARYTMRAMLLSWPSAVLPLVKEFLPRFGSRCDAPSLSTSLTRFFPDSASNSSSNSGASNAVGKKKDDADAHDVVLGVLGADGDEMRMVYVAHPQLDQPVGRAQLVRVERFERGMAVVSDEAGSLQRVCAAALEPDTAEDIRALPSTALRAALQACLPELAMFATQCLQEVLASEKDTEGKEEVEEVKEESETAEQGGGNRSGSQHAASTSATSAKEEKKAERQTAAAATTRQVVLHRPSTLLRVLRLMFNLNSSSSSSAGVTSAAGGAADRSGHATPQAGALSLGSASATLTLAEPAERIMLTLLPLLDTLMSAAQLDLPSPVLLREAWNELWCNPHLRRQVNITLPCSSPSSFADAKADTARANMQQPGDDGAENSDASLSSKAEELEYTYAEPAGIKYSSSAQRFDVRLRGHWVEGDKCLCPSCGKRWSACTAHHTVPSSWCDLLDRVLRRLQQRQSTSPSPLPKHASSSPYCGWFAEWTDGPLDAPAPCSAKTPSDDAAHRSHTSSGGSYDMYSPMLPPAQEDGPYRSPTSAQSLDARTWEDVDDSSEEVGEVAEDEEEAEEEGGYDAVGQLWSDYEASEVEDDDGEEDEEEEEEDNDGEAREGGAPNVSSDANAATTIAAAAGAASANPASAGERNERASQAEEETPMTLTVRRAAKPASSTEKSGSDEEDDVVYVEGNGETRQCSFTFTGSLISPTLLRGQMVFDRIDLPDVEREPVANQEWACPLCTFLNEPSAVRCAICTNARPGASWTCPVCSYAYNTLASATCVTCGCRRPSSVRRLHDAAGPCGYCTKCHQREHFRNFHAMRYRHHCSSCGTVTRWLPKDKFSTTIEARLVGDGGTLEFQWALDGYNTVCFGLHTRAYNADELWNLVDAAARRRGSSALKEVGRCVPPIPERPLSTPSSRPLATTSGAGAGPAAVSAASAQPCLVGAIVYYASALLLRYARLLPVEQLAEPGFLRRLHVCGSDWLDSWSQFPTSVVTPIFSQCLKLLEEGVRQPELVSTIATVALALIRQKPHALAAEKHALLYALCLNVARYGDAAQRKASYSCISALIEADPAATLNVQPLVPVLTMEPLLEGQQRATVLALLHHATMNATPAIAKACACMARTVVAMEQQRPLPPMLGKPFPYLVALTETRLSEGGELLVGQVRGSVGVAPNKGGKYYYEVEVPPEFISDRTKTIVMGWGTLEHERIASAQHVGSDLHSWGFNCREHLRLMMTEQALSVPRRPNQGDVIGSMMDLETMMLCWTINGQEISWVSVLAQGDGEEIFPYVSAAVEPQSVKIRLGNTRFKPAGYQDYTPPSDRDLWAPERSADETERSKTAVAAAKKRTAPLSHPPQSYEFYQQLSLALEEASITTLDDASILSLLDTTTARSVLRQYPKLVELMRSGPPSGAKAPHSSGAASSKMKMKMKKTSINSHAVATNEGSEENVQLLIPYIQRLRRTQDLTIVVARHLPLIEKSPYLMSCYKKATDLLFSSGRWTIFELQPGGRPKYSGGHTVRVLVSVRKARHVRKEADAEWLSQHPDLIQQHQQHQQQQQQNSPVQHGSSQSASSTAMLATQLVDDDDDDGEATSSHQRAVSRGADDAGAATNNRDGVSAASTSSRSNSAAEVGVGVAEGEEEGEEEAEEEEDEYADMGSDEDGDAGDALDDALVHSTSLAELRNALQKIYGDGSQLSPAERLLRCSVTGQLFTQLETTRVYQRARMFAVQLEGTLAVDAGGVTRAVMSMVGEELSYRFIRGVRVDPLLPLFQLCGHSTVFTVVPNMSALYASEAADDGAEGGLLRRMFEWLGKLIGNMVLCGTLKVSFDFPRLLWKTLTFQEDTITLADYAYDIDDNITAALEDDEFVLSDEFFAALPEHVRANPAFLKNLQGGNDVHGGEGGGGIGVGGGGGGIGTAGYHAAMPSTRPLRPYVCMTPAMSMQDMSHLALEELEEYAADAEAAEVGRRRALAQEALLHQYDPAFLAMRAGLTAVVPASSLRSVRWEDLRARVCGNGAASTEHVLAELDMSSLPPPMRAMLTQVLSNFTESQLSRFLLFCTGQSRIPLPEKVLVNCGDEAGRLPTAHTCSPISLLLQPCSTAAELQNSLEACLTHASEFGFV